MLSSAAASPLLAAGSGGVAPADRAVLLEFFKTTNGDAWTRKDGWNGPPGTECDWLGVACDYTAPEEPNHVVALYFYQNNLTGVLPASVAQLSKLHSFSATSNHLSGHIPDAWLAGWDHNTFELHVDAEQFDNLDYTISLTQEASSILCDDVVDPPAVPANYMVTFRSDGMATRYSVQCKHDRDTECVVHTGTNWNTARVGRLAQYLELQRQPTDNEPAFGFATHGTYITVSVCLRAQCNSATTYNGANPLPLFGLENAVLGLAAGTQWQRTSIQKECPAAGGTSPNLSLQRTPPE